MRIAMLLSVLLVQDSAEPYYRFKAGTSWKLIQKRDDKEIRVELTVTKLEEGKTTLESKESRPDGEPRIETMLWHVEKGMLMWSIVHDGKARPLFNLFKVGSKKGDTWEGDQETQAENMGTEEVKVPAGTYKDVLHVRVTRKGKDDTMDFWFAPKVGLVKMEIPKKGVTELTEFKEAP